MERINKINLYKSNNKFKISKLFKKIKKILKKLQIKYFGSQLMKIKNKKIKKKKIKI